MIKYVSHERGDEPLKDWDFCSVPQCFPRAWG